MRGLKICLWIVGILCLLSVLGMFLPVGVIESFVQLFGEQSFPDSPVFVYSLRLMSATYAGVGVYFIILAMEPMKYGIMVPFSGWAAVVLGIICAITGAAVGMPVMWFMGDSLSCLILGVLILLFWQKSKKISETSADTM